MDSNANEHTSASTIIITENAALAFHTYPIWDITHRIGHFAAMDKKKNLFILIAIFSLFVTLIALHEVKPELDEGVMCGPTSLYALCEHLYPNIRWKLVYSSFGASSELTEVNLSDIRRVASKIGLSARGERMGISSLRRMKPKGILHIDNTHFVALYGYYSNGVCVADPVGIGKYRDELWPYRYLGAHWDGRILIISNGSASASSGTSNKAK